MIIYLCKGVRKLPKYILNWSNRTGFGEIRGTFDEIAARLDECGLSELVFAEMVKDLHFNGGVIERYFIDLVVRLEIGFSSTEN